MSNIISVVGVSKSFSDGQVIQDLSFEVKKGEIFVILGKNGAGKTTLIKLMLNILLPDKGEIRYKERPISEYSQNLYHLVSAVLENSENIYGYLTAKQNIEYFSALYKKKLNKTEMDRLLELFDLKKFENKKASQFSRGMKQKLSIICTLLNDAEILFLDEPTLGLDFKANRELLALIKKMASEMEKTIILTSHQTDVIETLADKIMLLDQRKISYLGTYRDFIASNSLTSYRIVANIGTFDYLQEDEATAKLTELLNTGHEILSYQKQMRSVEDILVDYYQTGEEA